MESLVADPANIAQIAEGKTKIIYSIRGHEDFVLIRSKDQLTAFNATRKNILEGKARIANKTTINVFKLLNSIGLATHFIEEAGINQFIAKSCKMIPIEWVARRIATGSFLKRNPGVPQGYRFDRPKIETFFKVNLMKRMTSVIFRVLEKCWSKKNCVLIDMKVEFGVTCDKQIVLADVIDNDSWRVWPHGDKRLQLDKQLYRDLEEVTPEALHEVISNYEKVMELTAEFTSFTQCRAVIIMGSPSDQGHAEKIAASCRLYGITPILRISSAHKATSTTLDIMSEYEADEIPTVIIAVAGLSNGLGPVLSGNSTLPVINCPPVTDSNIMLDMWSSIRMPSGIGCATVIGADESALCAAKLFASQDHMIFGKILTHQLNNLIKLLKADKTARS